MDLIAMLMKAWVRIIFVISYALHRTKEAWLDGIDEAHKAPHQES